jgi:hypothetical protein
MKKIIGIDIGQFVRVLRALGLYILRNKGFSTVFFFQQQQHNYVEPVRFSRKPIKVFHRA